MGRQQMDLGTLLLENKKGMGISHRIRSAATPPHRRNSCKQLCCNPSVISKTVSPKRLSHSLLGHHDLQTLRDAQPKSLVLAGFT